MSSLTIALDDLIMAMETGGAESEWYLDRETGEIILVSDVLTGEPDDPADRVESEPNRYLFIEPISSHGSWQMMADFVETVNDEYTRRDLERAVHGAKPFRCFKDALLEHPDERERWFHLKNDACRRYAESWLADNGIEAKLMSVAEQARPASK